MFDEVFGLPLHVLVVHLTVVALPSGSLLALAYAVLPGSRWLLRWPLLALGLATPVLTWVAVQSGYALERARQLAPLVEIHEARAELLLGFTIGFAVVCVAAAGLLGGPSPLASGRGARAGGPAPVRALVGVALVALAAAVLVQTVLTGHAGSRAVWG